MKRDFILRSLFVKSVIVLTLNYLSNTVLGYSGSSSSNISNKSKGFFERPQQYRNVEKSSVKSSQSVRYPRSDPNYIRNYHYSSRGEDANGWDSGRQLTSLNSLNSLNSLQPGASSPVSDYIFGVGAEDNYAAAGGHGHSSYGGGGGHSQSHGYGGNSEHVNTSAVGLLGFLALLSLIQFPYLFWIMEGKNIVNFRKNCNSALGLLGVLGLASYLQNVLRQMSTTAAPVAPGRRRKRDLFDNSQYPRKDDLSARMFPLLMAIGQARERNVPIKCTYRPICLANKMIIQELGEVGRPVSSQLSNSIQRMVSEMQPNNAGLRAMRMLEEAGKAGRAGMQCEKLFRYCPELFTSSTMDGNMPSFLF